MFEKVRFLGQVSLVQLQPGGLIIKTPGQTPTGRFFDPTRLVPVDSLTLTPLGIEATNPGGERVLDIHHMEHPDKAYGAGDLISVGFTAHYAAMRAHFGEHMVDGIAGENIIVESAEEVWSPDLASGLGIENQDTGEMATLELVRFASPCVEFTQFCARSQYERLPKGETKEFLRFLGDGRRGFLLVLNDAADQVAVRPGDKVFALG